MGIRRITRTHPGIPILCLLLAGVEPVRAEPILDQSFEGPFNLTTFFGDPFFFAQTFTVGVGGKLSRIDLPVFEDRGPGSLVLDIRPTFGGFPVENDALALGVLVIPSGILPPYTGSPQFTSFDFRPFEITVAEGDLLAFVMHSIDDGRYGFSSATGDPYLRGQPFDRNHTTGGMWAPADFIGQPFDRGFRTYVDPAAIPEPSTVLLLGLGGLIVLGSTRRLRERSYELLV